MINRPVVWKNSQKPWTFFGRLRTPGRANVSVALEDAGADTSAFSGIGSAMCMNGISGSLYASCAIEVVMSSFVRKPVLTEVYTCGSVPYLLTKSFACA